MKKTQIKDAFRMIRKKFISFISIALVVMLGVGIFLACNFGTTTLDRSVNRYYEEKAYHDIVLRSSKGLTEEDLEAVREVDGVVQAEGLVELNLTAKNGASEKLVRFITATEMDGYDVLEGRAPENAGECAVASDAFRFLDLHVGDTITVEDKSDSGLKLTRTEFTVTASIRHPDQYRVSETSILNVVVQPDVFDREKVTYTTILIRTPLYGGSCFSSEYRDEIRHLMSVLTGLGEKRAPLRDSELTSDGWKMVGEMEKIIDENSPLLKEGEEKLRQALTQLTIGNAIIEQSKKTLESNLDIIRTVIDDSWNPAWGSKPEIGTLEEISDNFRKPGAEVIETIKSAIFGFISPDGSRAELIDRIDKLGLWSKIAELYDQIPAAIKDLEEGQTAYDKGLAEFNEKSEQFKELTEQLTTAKDQLNKYEPAIWILTDRTVNISFHEIEESIRSMRTIGLTFAVLFVLLSLLVCYATVGKIVDEQRKLIGTSKALGFRNGEILRTYLLFGGLAAAGGAVLGVILAYSVLQAIMVSSVQKMYPILDGGFTLNVLPSALAVVFSLAVGLLSAWLACRKLLAKPAISLLSGEIPLSFGKEKERKDGKKPRSLYAGLILRNIRSDLKRVCITIGSIAGCCILLMIGLTIRFSFGGIVNKQFDNIIKYDAVVSFVADEDGTQQDAVSDVLEKNMAQSLPAYRFGSVLNISGNLEMVQVVCASPYFLPDYYSLYDITKEADVPIPNGGIVIWNRLAEVYHLTIGDHISLLDEAGHYHDITVSGIYESYTGRDAFLSIAAAKEMLGESNYRPNSFLVRWDGKDDEACRSELTEMPGVTDYVTNTALRHKYEEMAGGMDTVVYVMIVMAAIMAAVVLLNLVRIQISQKKKELIVMRINGFTFGETAGYILRENIFTTAAGILIGIGAGILASIYNLMVIERVDVMMIRSVSWPSCLISAGITLLFAAVIQFIALRGIRKLKLTDVNEA